jgi:hypothetical protein
MDERFHECTMSSNVVCPSASPTIVFATTTSSFVAKPYSTQMCDEYPIGYASFPTTNGTVSTP